MVSDERALHALALFEAMARAGYLGSDPETALALADLKGFIEQTTNSKVQHGEGTEDVETQAEELPADHARE